MRNMNIKYYYYYLYKRGAKQQKRYRSLNDQDVSTDGLDSLLFIKCRDIHCIRRKHNIFVEFVTVMRINESLF